jgi:hypothetical protein
MPPFLLISNLIAGLILVGKVALILRFPYQILMLCNKMCNFNSSVNSKSINIHVDIARFSRSSLSIEVPHIWLWHPVSEIFCVLNGLGPTTTGRHLNSASMHDAELFRHKCSRSSRPSVVFVLEHLCRCLSSPIYQVGTHRDKAWMLHSIWYCTYGRVNVRSLVIKSISRSWRI